MAQPIEDFHAAVSTALTGRPAARTATDSGLPRDAIRSVLLGRDPHMSRADEICRALAITFTLGLPRDDPTADQTLDTRPRTGTVPIDDRQLADLLARLAEHWETIDVDDRTRLAATFTAVLDLARAKGTASLQRAVQHLGWRGLDDGPSSTDPQDAPR